MERSIGDLGQEIKQPSNPFANLAQHAVLRGQINSLQAACSSLHTQPLEYVPPHAAENLGGGFYLLRALDKFKKIGGKEGIALAEYWSKTHPTEYADEGVPTITRWARVRLPNGQIARSH